MSASPEASEQSRASKLQRTSAPALNPVSTDENEDAAPSAGSSVQGNAADAEAGAHEQGARDPNFRKDVSF